MKVLTALCLICTYSIYINDFSKDTLYPFTVDTHMWFTLVVLTAVKVDLSSLLLYSVQYALFGMITIGDKFNAQRNLNNSVPYLYQMCGEALSLGLEAFHQNLRSKTIVYNTVSQFYLFGVAIFSI